MPYNRGRGEDFFDLRAHRPLELTTEDALPADMSRPSFRHLSPDDFITYRSMGRSRLD
jgi:hypothetical protein